jgi:eukaryotic-like serine/threonine-protein kinase
MAERDTLLSTLPPEVIDDAERLYDDLGGIPDPRDIVGELHKRGLLNAGQLKDAVLSLEASLQIRHFKKKPPKGEHPHTILGQLGAGAMGEVLIAKDPGLNRIVAVKRLHQEAAKRRSLLRRFYTEAQVTAQLDHPSIVPIHGIVDIGDETLAYAMKLVRGRTLEDFFEEAKTMFKARKVAETHTLTARLERFLHVCDAMAYAHERGILHRDLKPENIMVGAFGEVMIMDWGIAKVLANSELEELDDTSIPMPKGSKGTKVGTVMGTPRYMSPEQAKGETDTMDAHSDQYALGLILQELTGLKPAVKDDLPLDQALDWARRAKRLPFTHFHRKGRIHRELIGIVDKATQKNPSNRYRDVTHLAEDIRRFLRDEAPKARPDNPIQKLQRFISRHRGATLTLLMMLMMGIVVVSLLGILGAIGAVEFKRQQAKARELAITDIVQLVSSRGRAMDQELARIEGLASDVGSATQQALSLPALPQAWDPISQLPPDQFKSKHYGSQVSVTYPELGTAEGTNPKAVKGTILQLAGIGNRMGAAMSASHPKGLRTRDGWARQIGDKGVPLIWMRVATASGIQATLPGTRRLKQGISDPRDSAWYKGAASAGGPFWSDPHGKTRGLGLVMTCAVPWINPNGKVGGVVGVDYALSQLERLMAAPAGSEGLLVDAEGRILIRHGENTQGKTWEPQPFPRKDVWEAMQADPIRGTFETGTTLALWTPIEALDATYVILGDSSALLNQKARRDERLAEPDDKD